MEILLDHLEEEGVFANYADANESAYKVVKDLNSSRNPIISDEKGKGTVSVTLDSSFLLSKSQGNGVIELDGVYGKECK